jgi:hypothetical protein
LPFGPALPLAYELTGNIVEPSATPAAVRKNSRRLRARFRLSSSGDADLCINLRSSSVGVLIEKSELI